MLERLSDNIHGNSLKQKAKTLARLQRRQPPWTLVMDNLDLAREVKARVGRGNVIFRAWPDDDLFRRVSPERWVKDSKARIGDADLWCYAGNEQGWSVQAAAAAAKAMRSAAATSAQALALRRNPIIVWLLSLILRVALPLALKLESYQAISVVKWNIEVVKYAQQYGLKVVVGNFSSGTPNPEDWKHPLALELLRLLDECREFAVLGLHEYACGIITSGFVGGWPQYILPEDWPGDVRQMTLWHLGRYLFLIQACEAAGIPVPRLVITEFAFDDMSDVKAWAEMLPKTPGYSSIRGWRSLVEAWKAWYGARGWSAERALFEQVRYALRVVYWHPAVEGVLFFCEGASSYLWEQFNKEEADEFESLWDQALEAEGKPMFVPESGKYYRLTYKAPPNLNLRKAPGTAAEDIGDVASGDVLFVRSPVRETANGYIWVEVDVYRNGTKADSGWVAATYPGLDWGQPVDAPTPLPEPEPPPQENWRDLLSEMERDMLRVAALVTEEPALSGYVSLGYNTDVVLKLLNKVAGLADART